MKRFLAMIKQTIYFLMLTAVIWADSNKFDREILIYSAGFRFFPAGKAVLSFSSDSLDGKLVFLLTTSVKTNIFLDAFYQVRDEIQSWLDRENFSLKKTIQTIREGSYQRDHEAVIQGDSIAVWANNLRELPGKVYDPVAFIYYLRNQNLKLGNSYRFFSYNRKKIREVMVDITARETIHVPAGTYTCLKAGPVSSDGKPLLKNNGEIRVWLSDDSLKLPVKIEQKTNLGTMVMKLKEIKHYSQ